MQKKTEIFYLCRTYSLFIISDYDQEILISEKYIVRVSDRRSTSSESWFLCNCTKIWCRMKSSIWCRHLVKVIDNLFWKLQFSTICFVSERRNVLERQILIILKVSFSSIVNTFLYFFFNSDTLFITLTSVISWDMSFCLNYDPSFKSLMSC